MKSDRGRAMYINMPLRRSPLSSGFLKKSKKAKRMENA
jgi:hypothetical protein